MKITETLTNWIHSHPEQAATVKNALTVCVVGIVSCVNLAYYGRSLQGRTSLLTTTAALFMAVPLYMVHQRISSIRSGDHCESCKADKYFKTFDEHKKTYLHKILNELSDLNIWTEQAKAYWRLNVWENPHEVEYLFLKGMSANIMDTDGNTLFHLAAPQGNQETMEILLRYGADINAQDRDGSPPLHNAVCKNLQRTMGILLNNGAKIDAQDNEGHTCLHLAARWSTQKSMTMFLKTMEILIEKGASIDAKDNEGHTPLHLAAYCGNLDAIKLLIENGADVLLHGSMRLPSEIARYCGGWGEAAIYLNSEERKKQEENEKNTPKIKVFSDRVRPSYSQKQRSKKVKEEPGEVHSELGPMRVSTTLHRASIEKLAIDLVDKGVNKEAQDQEGCTPLHRAAERGDNKIIEILSDGGVNMEAVDDQGCTPFLRAAARANPDILQLLIERGANQDAQTRGLPALHWAALNGNQANVDFLLENGADIEAKDDKGQTPLHLAAQEKLKPLTYDGEVIQQKNLVIIKYLVKNRQAKIDAQDKEGKTPLAIAIECQNLEATQLLLDLSANKEITDKLGRTPLAIACCCLNLDAIKALLSRGANRDAIDKDGKTLLALIDEHGDWFPDKKSKAKELLQAQL